MTDILKISMGAMATLGVTGFLWLIRTVMMTRSELDIAYVKIRYLEEQLKEIKHVNRANQTSLFEQNGLG